MAELTKSVAAKSEAWLSAITSIGAIVTAYTTNIQGASMWVALGICIVLAATYAFFHTPLASTNRPGVKTKTFWGAIIVIVASVATAIAETNVVGVSAKVLQIAGMVSAAAVALGYNIFRYQVKKAR